MIGSLQPSEDQGCRADQILSRLTWKAYLAAPTLQRCSTCPCIGRCTTCGSRASLGLCYCSINTLSCNLHLSANHILSYTALNRYNYLNWSDPQP
ncbi:hypothetical protein DL93DRAFT_1093669 [Clavulina sp. PMI_390]|nr:hypothetical protein DL93DRAFT_1093669 [Clavulina sp. PMI_390]